MSEDMLDDLYDCLNYLTEIQELNELNNNESEILNKAYNIIKNLYNRYM